MQPETSLQESFEGLVADAESGLRQALMALFGPDDGREATAHALLYGWEHWDRLRTMDHPAGYLYRVGQTWGQRHRRPVRQLPSVPTAHEAWVEPGLPIALMGLPPKQRVAVVLRHGSDWSYERIAEFMGTSVVAARKNVERALQALRSALEVDSEV
ncbi:MAG: sigma factor-like helix-turn-helix DNA-binding protein [Acidimicrobiia bacterium]